MSVIPAAARAPRHARYRLRRALVELGSAAVAVVVLIWSLIPIYNMLLIALDPTGDNEFAGLIWPEHASLNSFAAVWSESADDVEHIWQQFGNSIYIGLAVMVLTVLIGSLAAFAVGRMRLGRGWTLTDAALLTYVIPSSTLVIPFYRIIHLYGLTDNLWAVIAAEVTFAVPYAIVVLQYYGKLIPAELDEAARIDGASPIQVYWRIYVPLMAPVLAALGTYALLFAWNDYLYQYLMLSSNRNTTVAVAIEHFFDDDDSPWNYMMAISLLYSLPPIAVFYGLRRYMVTGLSLGSVKG